MKCWSAHANICFSYTAHDHPCLDLDYPSRNWWPKLKCRKTHTDLQKTLFCWTRRHTHTYSCHGPQRLAIFWLLCSAFCWCAGSGAGVVVLFGLSRQLQGKWRFKLWNWLQIGDFRWYGRMIQVLESVQHIDLRSNSSRQLMVWSMGILLGGPAGCWSWKAAPRAPSCPSGASGRGPERWIQQCSNIALARVCGGPVCPRKGASSFCSAGCTQTFTAPKDSNTFTWTR